MDRGPGSRLGRDPWLPWPPQATTRNAEVLRADEDSILWLYRRLIALRRVTPALCEGDLSLVDGPEDVLAYRRGGEVTVLANFGDRPVPMPRRGRVLLASGPADGDTLGACTAVVLATGRCDPLGHNSRESGTPG